MSYCFINRKIIMQLDDSSEVADGLDEISFRHFAPLLASSQEYAGHTGCRFRGPSFDGIEDLAAMLARGASSGNPPIRYVDAGPIRYADAGSRLAAKLQAAPAVRSFGDRLLAGEPALIEELETAFRIIVAESARNMMIATVKGLGLFPPENLPEGISAEDCCYEDVSAPLPVIAQRLYNDHVRRQRDECSSARRQQRRSLTAAFLVDFAYEVGAELPGIPETYQTLLQEFAARNADFKAQDAVVGKDDPGHAEKESVKESMVPAKADAPTGWLQRWQTALWAPSGATSVSEAQKAPQRRMRQTGCV